MFDEFRKIFAEIAVNYKGLFYKVERELTWCISKTEKVGLKHNSISFSHYPLSHRLVEICLI